MKDLSWLEALVLAAGIAGGGWGCSEKIPTHTSGTIKEITMDQTKSGGENCLLKVEAEEGDYALQRSWYTFWKGKEDKINTIQQRTYFLYLEQGPGLPLEIIRKAMFVNSRVIFPYLTEDEGKLRCPINRFCTLPSEKLHVLRPFEDPQQVKEEREGASRKKYQAELKAEEERAMKEALNFYKETNRPKE